jgi:hypothetical protein
MRCLVIVFVCGIVVLSFCQAQNASPIFTRDISTAFSVAVSDSVIHQFGSDTAGLADTGAYHPTKKPWLAVGLSAAVPGLGQLYNQNYWKTPIIWGLGGYYIYEWISLNNKYKDFRDQYSASLSPLLPSGNAQLQRVRDFYHDERDKFAWYMGALYFLNLVDAYVSANLYDFNVGSDLGADGRMYPKVTATLRAKF